VFTRALHWSLSWASSVQSIPSHPISLRSILILSEYYSANEFKGLDFSTRVTVYGDDDSDDSVGISIRTSTTPLLAATATTPL
jgi:hypothetical protein